MKFFDREKETTILRDATTTPVAAMSWSIISSKSSLKSQTSHVSATGGTVREKMKSTS